MLRKSLLIVVALSALTASSAFASNHEASTVAAGGYDVITYFDNKRPVRGSGHFVSEYDGATYLFTTAANKKKFDRNPAKYAPAYGGFCAYGVSVGKKFVGDPEVYRVVNGTLYLNLDAGVQDLWLADSAKFIKKADKQWPQIVDKAPSGL
ncbi:MAG: YHS domain-containing (seleno)protein [Myxococcota bacterium]